ncbi:MAG: chemotaxis protein CheA [Pseudomonadota bacterium]
MSNPSDTFREEASDILESLEQHLLELEADPTGRELVDTVFRALHTIKGSGEMFGYSVLAGFVHKFENAFDMVRSGKSVVTEQLIDISLRSRDHIAALLDAGLDEAATSALAASETHIKLMGEIEQLTSEDGAPAPAAAAEEKKEEPTGPGEYLIKFKPDGGALRNGMRPDLLIDELRELGECEAHVIYDDVPPIEDMDPSESYLAWEIQLTTSETEEKINDLFLFFDDGDISVERQDTPEEQAPAEEAPGGTPAKPAAAKPAQKEEGGDSSGSSASAESVRVQAHRLDELMDQLGELVIAQARLNRIAERLTDSVLTGAAEEIERLVTGMRDATLSIRMLPISGVFSKFRRVVRDLSTELNKNVKMVAVGGDTELDKNIIDRLSEPLVHIIRNSIDHGIENADERGESGKSPAATVTLMARQTGGEVHISVNDDGKGLNTEAIRKRAIERGLIEEGVEHSEESIHQLIFAPGFSTAEKLSSISGRGVGMDAVRNFVEDLRGAVDVSSKTGEGTTITLRLPLTLAIIDGLLVRVGDGDFVIPLASVEECVELSEQEAQQEERRSLITIRDELIPVLRLGRLFQFTTDESASRAVIVNADGRRVGLIVDDVIGQHQTVIKSLSAYHRAVEGLAGCTILGDGSVALIIDPAALVKSRESRRREAA